MAEAARLLGRSAGILSHHVRRVLGVQHRPGKRYRLTDADIEQLRQYFARRVGEEGAGSERSAE